jgi:hypothetical protein
MPEAKVGYAVFAAEANAKVGDDAEDENVLKFENSFRTNMRS